MSIYQDPKTLAETTEFLQSMDGDPAPPTAAQAWHDPMDELPVIGKPNVLVGALWFLSGANRKMMACCPLATQAKYVGLGLTVLIPFALGTAAGSLTVLSITGNLTVSVATGFFIGCMILGIDVAIMRLSTKYIDVSGLERTSGSGVGRGNWLGYLVGRQEKRRRLETTWGRTLFQFVTRVALATIIGMVVGHSLLLAAFDGRIQTHVEGALAKELAGIRSAWQAQRDDIISNTPPEPTRPVFTIAADADDIDLPGKQGIDSLTQQISAEEQKLDGLYATHEREVQEWKDAQDLASGELHHGTVTGKPGSGPHYERLKEQERQEERDIERIDAQIDSTLSRIATLKGERDGAGREYARALDIESQRRTEFLERQQETVENEHAAKLAAYWQHMDRQDAQLEAIAAERDFRIKGAQSRNRGDLLTRTEALEEITHESGSLQFWKWMILLALVALDTIPVFLKLTKPVDAYDELASLERFRFQRAVADTVERSAA